MQLSTCSRWRCGELHAEAKGQIVRQPRQRGATVGPVCILTRTRVRPWGMVDGVLFGQVPNPQGVFGSTWEISLIFDPDPCVTHGFVFMCIELSNQLLMLRRVLHLHGPAVSMAPYGFGPCWTVAEGVKTGNWAHYSINHIHVKSQA